MGSIIILLVHQTFTLPPTTTGIKLKDLCRELESVNDWFHLGLYLDLSHEELTNIQSNYGEARRRRTEVLDSFIRNSTSGATWAAVVEALQILGEDILATRIAAKYGVDV